MSNDDELFVDDIGQELDLGGEDTDDDYAGSVVEESEEMRWLNKNVDIERRCKSVVIDSLWKDGNEWDDIEDYKKKALCERFGRDSDGSLPTALHAIAKDYYHDYHKVPQPKLIAVLKYLLEEKAKAKVVEQSILTLADSKKGSGLLILLGNEADFRQYIPDLVSDTNSNGRNFLHYILLKKKNNQYQQLKGFEGKLVIHAPKRAVVAQDEDGNTPLHYAMNYDYMSSQKSEGYYKLLHIWIQRADADRDGDPVKKAGLPNYADESPYMAWVRTREEQKLRKKKELERLAEIAAKNAESTQSREKAAPTPTMESEQKQQPQQQQTRSGDPHRARHHYNQTSQPQQQQAEYAAMQKDKKAPYAVAGSRVGRSEKPSNAPRTLRVQPPDPSGARVTSSMGPPPTPSIAKQANAFASKKGASAALSSGAKKGHGEGKSDATAEGDQSLDEGAEKMGETLRLYYLRTRPDLEARKLLYGKVASDMNIYLDLSHLKGLAADQILAFIQRLAVVSKFDDTLSYVSIPSFPFVPVKETPAPKRYTANQSSRRENAAKPPKGRQSLVPMFDKLHSLGVKKILRLQVDDTEYPAHTDEAIEKALTGSVRDPLAGDNPIRRLIDIEAWDWRKFDLCSDVIQYAAPQVEKMHLYWSGNPTVLKGWASKDSIPKFYATNENLKTVVLHADQGLEKRPRAEKLVALFVKNLLENSRSEWMNVLEARQEKMMKGKSDHKKSDGGKLDSRQPIDVDVKWNSISGLATEATNKTVASNRPDVPQQHKWVEHLENFRGALKDIHDVLARRNVTKIRRVKVAVIDDGCSLGQLNWYNDAVKVTGVSYCPPQGDENIPWYTSSGEHGTTMVNMVTRIVPWVDMFVMKLEDGVSAGGRTIYPRSAAQAIEGAISHGADIISMSWTIKHNQSNGDSPGIAELESAIQKAKRRGILLFCSASDEIDEGATGSLPYSAAKKYAFRIGAALSYGQRDAATEDHSSIDYFCPGNQVAETWNPRSDKTVQYHDGSSVATALAAGLAALIMHCAELLRADAERRRDADPKWYEILEHNCDGLRVRSNMKTAIDNIKADGAPDDPKFPPVWGIFGNAALAIGETRDADAKMKTLEEVVNQLTLGIDLKKTAVPLRKATVKGRRR
ncbi:hypothetical protein MKZ38_000098 [Zalerion maritima]|uniref:Peptidase S8/S53 domain-containing protein n=1 Tax=Zalerion maritima TaxID=339359 RepID=A0AAD5WTY6_9PEZI|nr:hypothetical protein MKZ38_000098 [Zalerion maritima]